MSQIANLPPSSGAADALPTTIKSHKEAIECKIYSGPKAAPKVCALCALLLPVFDLKTAATNKIAGLGTADRQPAQTAAGLVDWMRIMGGGRKGYLALAKFVAKCGRMGMGQMRGNWCVFLGRKRK